MVTPLYLPQDLSKFHELRAGQEVLLSGTILTARDAAHLRLFRSLEASEDLPLDLRDTVIYYSGPSPAPPGKIFGSCGPTTASRMDPFTPALLRQGVRGTIGKGPRSADVLEAMGSHRAVYFYAFGGCGALYARKVVAASVLAYADLGPEAIFSLEIHEFPLVVAADSLGSRIF